MGRYFVRLVLAICLCGWDRNRGYKKYVLYVHMYIWEGYISYLIHFGVGVGGCVVCLG